MYAGRMSDVELVEPKEEDTFMLSYTSGTTGDPKGVKLTHRMVSMMCHNTNERIREQQECNENDVYLSYLPLGHSQEQSMLGLCAIYGL